MSRAPFGLRPGSPAARVTALALAASLGLVGLLGLAVPWVEARLAARAEIGALAEARSALAERVARATPEADRADLADRRIGGATPAEAALRLQRLVADAIGGAGATPTDIQAEVAESGSLRAMARFVAGTESLPATLRRLEAGPALLHVTSLSIHARPGATDAAPLDVQLTVEAAR